MEGFVFSPYNYNVYPGCSPYNHSRQKPKYQNWSKKSSVFVAPEAVNYLDFYKRAQLRAILSQVNPNLASRLTKANTKEFGVQVNPKVDAVVQCSLGPKTLFYRERKWFPSKSLVTTPILTTNFMPRTPVNNVRFSKPIAIYSPVFDRRFFTLPDNADCNGSCEWDEEEDDQCEEDSDSEVKGKRTEGAMKHEDVRQAVKETPSPVPRKFNFQFLEQKYGFFHCSKCNIRWESAYVWCISGTNKVYFKQLCRKCQVGFNPYRVESIQCQACGQTRCSCEKKQRHIDMTRPHRQDLCGRCRGKRLSCDTTYSFKYIV
ncbi:ZAR1-like protein [Megalops cyprinoides]|uniref:ZAR1-like protein n=1 Tax=Megalops cyprinoides TaxID=118141 RepID=UPI00186455AE|nr:ZAR1-like protein [Megalops cyprinoides]